MKDTLIQMFFGLLIAVAPAYCLADETKEIKMVANIYLASMDYIFSQQDLINGRYKDKSELFGDKFIANVMQMYHAKFTTPLAKIDSTTVQLLLQVMVEVMEDNRTLILDSDLGFKGFIPAVYAFQISQKFIQKGRGVKLKFTNSADRLRNPFNAPDAWESAAISSLRDSGKKDIYSQENTSNGVYQSRYMVQVEMSKMCLGCHGSISQNTQNIGKDKTQWSHIDKTGFKMENWTINDFAGAVSVAFYQIK